MEASEASEASESSDIFAENSDNDTTVERVDVDKPEEEVKYNIFFY